MFYLNGWCWPIFNAVESPFPKKPSHQVDNNIDHPTIELLSHPISHLICVICQCYFLVIESCWLMQHPRWLPRSSVPQLGRPGAPEGHPELLAGPDTK